MAALKHTCAEQKLIAHKQYYRQQTKTEKDRNRERETGWEHVETEKKKENWSGEQHHPYHTAVGNGYRR